MFLFTKYILLIIILFVILACNNANLNHPSQDPRTAALYFIEQIALGQIENAKTVVLPSNYQFLDIVSTLLSEVNTIDTSEIMPTLMNLSIAECNINEDKATCLLCCYDEVGAEITLQLVEKDEKWLVILAKENDDINNIEIE